MTTAPPADWFAALRQKQERRRAIVAALVDGGEGPVLLRSRSGRVLFVTRAPRGRAWRLYVFDEAGPWGDYGAGAPGRYRSLFEATLALAVFDWGGDIATATRTTAETADADLAALLHPASGTR